MLFLRISHHKYSGAVRNMAFIVEREDYLQKSVNIGFARLWPCFFLLSFTAIFFYGSKILNEVLLCTVSSRYT